MARKPTYEELAQRVQEITSELMSANERLRTEIEELTIAEQALKESEENYRNIFNNAQAGLYRTRISDGKVLECNDRFAENFGYQNREDCIREYFFSEHYVDDGTREEMLAQLQEKKEIRNFEARFSRKDGSIAWMRYSARIYPGKGYLEGAQFDITEEKKAVDALRESEQKFKSLSENTPDIIFVMGLDGEFIYVNPAIEKILGFNREDVLGKPLTELGMVDSKKHIRLFNRIKEKKETVKDVDVTLRHKDGSPRLLSWCGAPNFDSEGNVSGIVGLLKDVTEHRKLEAQLLQARKMESIGTLAGGIAHEFNNLLGIIVGNTELAIDDVPEWNPAHNNLKAVRKACLRARDLVRQILAFSHQSEQKLKPVKVGRIIKESLKFLRSSLPTTIEIRENISAKSDIIHADPTQLNQVLINLCTNGAHAMGQTGGVLEVNLENIELNREAIAHYHELTPGSYIRLNVSDTGHGMEPEIMGRIFDPYFTTKEVGQGTGMGLAVVHGIVKNHGGAISVNSELGKGTTFQVLLPIVEGDVQEEFETIGELRKGNERIIFVDDEKAIVDAVKPMLERLGYSVTAVTNGMEALELFRVKPDQFQLVITDMTMPNMTGDKLAKALMEIRSDIPVILCTGYSERISENKAREMGIRGFSMKPLVMSELAVKIRQVLDKG